MVTEARFDFFYKDMTADRSGQSAYFQKVVAIDELRLKVERFGGWNTNRVQS